MEIWEEGTEVEILLDIDQQPPNLQEELSFGASSTEGYLFTMWTLKFLMRMQAIFKLSDNVLEHILKFIGAILVVTGKQFDCFPSSLYKAKKLLGVQDFQRLVVCRKCHSLYKNSDCKEKSRFNTQYSSKKCAFKAHPSHPHATMRLPCDTLLLKTVELSDRKTYLYPYLVYCYLGPHISLQSMFERPTFFKDCEHWKHRTNVGVEMRDVYDGNLWKEFISYSNEPFLSEEGNLGLILNYDHFQPYEHISYSLGAIYMSVLNLPRKIRYKRENMILVGLIPGPHEPQKNINTFLQPLVEDLRRLWKGVNMNIPSIKAVKNIRCALLCVACDIPAGRKICGFLGHSAKLGCARCLKEFPGGVGNKDYSGFDREQWEKRNKDAHNRKAFEINNLITITAIEQAESAAGCRYSELLLLPYFDAPRMLIVDVMHNLYLGTAKYFLKKILKRKGYLLESHLELIQRRINRFIVPTGVCRIRLKIESGFSRLTADQWKTWVLYFSLIALRDVVNSEILEIWRLYVMACRLLCTREISTENAKTGDKLLLQFCRHVESYFGKDCITPNMHYHCHIVECIEDYGPVQGFWCYPFERYNGLLGSTPNNNRLIEPQIMYHVLNENKILSFGIDDAPEPLLSCFPKMVHTGSVAETMLSADESTQAENAYILDCLQSIQLPKYKVHCILSRSEREAALKLYSHIYSLPASSIEIALTCFAYNSITYTGKLYGTYQNKTASSSIVMTRCDPRSPLESTISCSNLRAARINKFYKHTAMVCGELKTHLLVSLSWYEAHPLSDYCGEPVSIWHYDLFEYSNLIPVQLIVSRAVSLKDTMNGEIVLFVVPCIN